MSTNDTNDIAARQARFDAGMAAWQEAESAPRGSAEAYAASRRAASLVAVPAPTPAPVVAPAQTPTDYAAQRQAGIDQAIEVLRANGADLSTPVKSGHAGIIFNSATDMFTMTSAAPAAGTDAQPLYDDGSRDLDVERDALVAHHDALVAKLNAGKYDPETGQKVFDVTGRAREILELQVQQAKVSNEYGINQLNRIAAQRAAQSGHSAAPPIQMADGSTMAVEEAAARMAYIDSAPMGQRQAYAKQWDEQMQSQRTKNVTVAVAAARTAGRQR